MTFKIEFTKRAVKDLKRLSTDLQRQIVRQTLELEADPFPFKKKIKRIQGLKFPCYRLRIDLGSDSFRVFYGIENNIVFILRIIAKKDADKILKALRNIEFPPDIPQ
jgi:mRNA-degrading endonuclease RelE of RelBE toxin-antitoxin system